MFFVDIRSSKPIYEQIIDNIKEQAIKGILVEGDQLPSVRQLAGMLTVNPNTVSKAYQELERQGVIETIRGRGTFVGSRKQPVVDMDKLMKLRGKIKEICIEVQYMGLGEEMLKEEIRNIFSTMNKGDQT